MVKNSKEPTQERLLDPYAVYNARAAITDEALLKEANEGMDALMVFAGLFSAVIATLIQITWGMLVPNASDYTNQVLLSLYNATVNERTNYPALPDFQPTQSAVIINLLFFLSLILSLGTALGAMLVKEWARQYDPASDYENITWLRARDRHRRYESYNHWPLRTIHASLPMVIHAALLIFLIGIIIWTNQLHYRIYLTLLVTVSVGTAGYLALAFVPTFMDASPFKWPLSQAIRFVLRPLWNGLRAISGSNRLESRLQPPYILSPTEISLEREKSTQVKPSSYAVTDAAVLIDLMCNSSTHEELDASIDALLRGEWGGVSVSRNLMKRHDILFRRYRELAATCWDAESNTAWTDMIERIRRLLRFVEWFYYQLEPSQRRQVQGWPSTDLANEMRGHAEAHSHVGDFVLAESVLSKLHHIGLPDNVPCERCLDPQSTRPKYKMVKIASSKPKHYAIYYEKLLSACIWSDTDCILNYAPVGDVAAFKRLTKVTLIGYEYLFSQLRGNIPSDRHSELYPILRSLVARKTAELEDPRQQWFLALSRAMNGEMPFLEDDDIAPELNENH
ncbi:hypothetical protein M408DRAFT_329901 [Serendipita vermifera MAFF 305830]|uniref:DUF6535 domain-containing protein n=1 Tax=Serendipita vermifera MAFF 305830 TaxID=933852 RepID=A0A0C2WND0_SERVB|nr:hypothetical protein M408DRAFT_329901 [Serendipita vermifera MAFF 305830]